MTPQEKAKQLVDDVITKDYFLSWEYNAWKEAKKCALIAVDEIIDVIKFNKYDDKYWE